MHRPARMNSKKYNRSSLNFDCHSHNRDFHLEVYNLIKSHEKKVAELQNIGSSSANNNNLNGTTGGIQYTSPISVFCEIICLKEKISKLVYNHHRDPNLFTIIDLYKTSINIDKCTKGIEDFILIGKFGLHTFCSYLKKTAQQLLKFISDSIRSSPLYGNFRRPFKEHIEDIFKGKYNLFEFQMKLNLSNTLYRVENILEKIESRPLFFLYHYTMELVWDETKNVFVLSRDGSNVKGFLNPLYLSAYVPALNTTVDHWIGRLDLPTQITNECSICMMSFSDTIRKAVLSGCMHTFCTNCIRMWAKENDTCPYCREEFKDFMRYTAMERIKNHSDAQIDKCVILYSEDGL